MNDGEDLIGDERGQAQTRLVEEQQARLGHQGPSHGEHLLLAAGKGAGQLRVALTKFGEALIDFLQARRLLLLVQAQGQGAELQILVHRQVGEHLPPFRREGEALTDHAGRRAAGEIATIEKDAPGRRLDQSHQTLEQGTLAGAVGPDQGYRVAGGHLEADVEEGLGGPIMSGEIGDCQHQAVASMRPR